MKINDHLLRLKESLEVIDECIDKGIVERQRTIGFSVSAASIEMLEILLHQSGLIDPGTTLKHNWFNSAKQANERMPFVFPKKEEVISLMIDLEEKRNLLCYGKPKPAELITQTLEEFNRLKKILKEAGLNDI